MQICNRLIAVAVGGCRRVSAPIVVSISIILLQCLAIFKTYTTEVDSLEQYKGDKSSSINDTALESIWNDLQNISAQPHSYNSRAHERVRIFLLNRLNQIAAGFSDTSFAEIIEDNDSFVLTPGVIDGKDGAEYFEGQNIYGVIRGKNNGNSGVLVSGHYDSVSTSFGTTDDGIAIAIMLFLFKHFIANRPDNTIVFNFNTGEELGLHGARLFLKHPLLNDVTYFLNMDSAGAGGRSTMHRASNFEVLTAFAGVHPALGSVIMQDIFKTGVIKSMTDFSIYDGANLKGLDMAYYKPRSRYHTPLDNIRSTNRGSVRYLAQSSLRAVTKLSSGSTANLTSENAQDNGVFFDYLGKVGVTLSMKAFIGISLSAVILGPLALGGLLYYLIFKKKSLRLERGGWLRFPGTLVVLILANYFLLRIISVQNRDVIYSSDLPVLAIFLTSAVVSVFFLQICEIISPGVSSLNTLVELTLLYWLLALVGVIYQIKMALGGSYIFIVQYIGSLLATGLELIPYAKNINTYSVDSIQLTGPDNSQDGDQRDSLDLGAASDISSECAPLLPVDTPDGSTIARACTISNQAIESLIEFAQFIFISLIPCVLFLQMGFFAVSSLRHAVADGSSYILPYGAVSFAAIMVLLPMTPFIARMLRTGGLPFHASIVIALVLCATYVTTLARFPFTEQYPIKVFYEQVIDFTSASSDNFTDGGRTILTGIPNYVPTIIADIPSAKRIEPTCVSFPMSTNLNACSYPGLSPANYIAPGSPNEWIRVSMDEVSESPWTYIVKIHGTNTRGVELIVPNEVYPSSGSTLQFDIIQAPGGSNYTNSDNVPSISGQIHTMELWARCDLSVGQCDGSVPFVIRISNPSGSQIDYEAFQNIKAACNYDEWIPRAGPDLNDESGYKEIGRIPGLDEVFHYMPPWATFLKRTHGLVKVINGLQT
ncbi:hypothetical protein POJ06DRAFT_60572 [Lipomyces tetrasporus]|uniref:Peptide hydrolase n=1 Tax=Lipomyces tetrasporus TaxID=54092 RepID=A0AAD7QXW0_9ASCO|nr:uncharacterized protein POJ06DRAFT_60572 [Lipomyces tetrasporus]KAJ8102996.1 hypothetical protein POJ06DRAFT_60572 [Lipomyces tetrasporus]